MKKKLIILSIAAVVVLGAGMIIRSNEPVILIDERQPMGIPGGEDQADTTASTSGTYKDYSTEILASEQAAGNKIVLFFHAAWCPFCREADSVFRARHKELPGGVALLKIDYDSNDDLKQKYGVTYQHTFVQIDDEGNQVSKWNGGDMDNLFRYLK